MKNKVLNRVTVSFRCPMDWEAMAGDERQRFCSKCQKSVTDLSELTAEEASEFIAKEGPLGQACVRLWRSDDGSLKTKGCGSGIEVGKRIARNASVVAVAAGSLGVAACSSSSREEVPLMGMICLPNEKK